MELRTEQEMTVVILNPRETSILEGLLWYSQQDSTLSGEVVHFCVDLRHGFEGVGKLRKLRKREETDEIQKNQM